MSISILSTDMTQSNEKVAMLKTDSNKVKENDNGTIEKPQKDSINSNIGQKLDLVANIQKDRNEQQNIKQQDELKWARERQRMMSIKETKLLQMREIGDQAMQSKLTPQELKKLDDRLNSLSSQISSIESDSNRTKDGKIKY